MNVAVRLSAWTVESCVTFYREPVSVTPLDASLYSCTTQLEAFSKPFLP